MKCDKHTMLLYAVTDRAWTGRETLRQQVEDALKGGVTCVQLREKELDDAAFLQEAMELSALCRSYGVPFIINDNVDIAIQCHADGIHVGQEDMAAADVRAKVGPDMLLGVSAHSVEEARLAVAHGADYLGVGAAFSTHTKTDVDVLPEGELKKICDAVDVPVVAIGGIHKDNILQLKGSGADGVALVSAIFGAEDIEAECRKLKALAEQILLCTAGRGYYQERGKEPRELKPGDVVNIPAEVKHWHGAAPDSWFSHVAVEVPGTETKNEWCEPVSDEDYRRLK